MIASMKHRGPIDDGMHVEDHIALMHVHLTKNDSEIEKQREKEKIALKEKEKYHSLKEQGLCVRCGKKAYKNYIYCYEHYLKNRRRKREYDKEHNKNYKAQNLCSFCGKERMEGKKVCIECYKKLCDRLDYGRQLVDYENHPVAKQERTRRMYWGKYWRKKGGGIDG